MEKTEAWRKRKASPKAFLTEAERGVLQAVGYAHASKVLGISQTTARYLAVGGGVNLWTMSRVHERWGELAKRLPE